MQLQGQPDAKNLNLGSKVQAGQLNAAHVPCAHVQGQVGPAQLDHSAEEIGVVIAHGQRAEGHELRRLLHLSAQSLGQFPVRNVCNLVRADTSNAKQLAAQVKHLNRYVPILLLDCTVPHEAEGCICCRC